VGIQRSKFYPNRAKNIKNKVAASLTFLRNAWLAMQRLLQTSHSCNAVTWKSPVLNLIQGNQEICKLQVEINSSTKEINTITTGFHETRLCSRA